MQAFGVLVEEVKRITFTVPSGILEPNGRKMVSFGNLEYWFEHSDSGSSATFANKDGQTVGWSVKLKWNMTGLCEPFYVAAKEEEDMLAAANLLYKGWLAEQKFLVSVDWA